MSDGLRAGWRRWQFEQMATSVNVRVDDPAAAGVDHYVGLEHLDSDSLKIRRWGSPADVSATKLLFEPGDIIFARRRAYQRKLGVAEWRGIASAHSLVLRAKPDAVLPEFLPFFMQSDLFMDLAQRISVGSLSPTINWKTLARQEFALPPLEDQPRIALLMRQCAELKEGLEHAVASHEECYRSAIDDLVCRIVPDYQNAWDLKANYAGSVSTLDAIARVTDCKHRTPKFIESGIPIISPGDIRWGPLRLESSKRVSSEQYVSLMDHVRVDLLDLIMGRNQSVGVVSYVADDREFALGQDTIHIRALGCSAQYLFLALKSAFVQRQIAQLSMGTTFSRINLGSIRRLLVPVPNADCMRRAEAIFSGFEGTSASLRRRVAASAQLNKSLIESALQPE